MQKIGKITQKFARHFIYWLSITKPKGLLRIYISTSKTLHFRNHPFIMLTLFPSLFFSLFSNTFTHKNVPLIQLAEYRFIFTAVASFFNCFRLKKTEGNIAIVYVIQSLNISLIAIEFENVYGCIFRWLYRPTYNKLSMNRNLPMSFINKILGILRGACK